MPIDLNHAIVQIKKAGGANVRIVPMSGQNINDGDHQIEIKINENWAAVATGMKRMFAEQLVTQALNRTICG